ncbi:MAG: alkaline phosphatase family protein [Oligoflexus sp.]
MKRWLLTLLIILTIGVSVWTLFRRPQDEKLMNPSHSNSATKAQQTTSLRLFWLSLDGLQKAKIESLLPYLTEAHPLGLKYLLNLENWQSELEINNPTITASSHISTISCLPPGEHGIIANRQWNGSSYVSGFTADYGKETFVQTLVKHGLRVASLGYPSIDGSSPGRSASFGASYDDPINRGSIVSLSWGESRVIQSPSRINSNETIPIEVQVADDGKILTMVQGDQRFEAQVGDWSNIFFTTNELKHLTVVAFLARNEASSSVEIYISPTMINHAHPQSFQQRLDSLNLVFSPGKDSSLLQKYGDEVFLKSMEHRLHYFTSTARYILSEEQPEAFFMYLEDLDVLGHLFEGDEERHALVGQYLAKLDQAVGSIMEQIPDSTEIVILGDHGMAATQYELNVLKLIENEAVSRVKIMTSGGSLFVYGLDAPLDSMPPQNEAWFQKLVQSFRGARVAFDDNKQLFTKVLVKNSSEAQELGLAGAEMPWIIAFSEPGISLKTSFEDRLLLARRQSFRLSITNDELFPDPTESGTLVEPKPYGSHGYFSKSDEMRSSLLLHGPKLSQLPASSVKSNIRLVPAVADALQLPRPSGCSKLSTSQTRPD